MKRMQPRDETRCWGRAALGIATVLVGIAVVLVPADSWAQGCSMCATYLSNGKDPRSEAFKLSIMFLMAMPFLIVGTTGGWIFWMYRRSRARQLSLDVLEVETEGAS